MARWYTDRKGYRRFSDSGIAVHRWSASRKLGRSLGRDEVVHHINRNRQDNNPRNLWVWGSQTKHDRVHKYDKKRTGFW